MSEVREIHTLSRAEWTRVTDHFARRNVEVVVHDHIEATMCSNDCAVRKGEDEND